MTENPVLKGILAAMQLKQAMDQSSLQREELARRFALATLDGLGVGPDDAPAIGAAGALLRYLTELQPSGLPHLARPFVRRSDAFLWLDEMTRRNLELVEPLRAGARACARERAHRPSLSPPGRRWRIAWWSGWRGRGSPARTTRSSCASFET